MPYAPGDGFPRIDGSTSAAPLGAQIICAMMEVPLRQVEFIDGNRYLIPGLAEYQVEFPGSGHQGTHAAYPNLIDGNADLILVARSPSQEELELAGCPGVSFDIGPIALDAFVFIVNENSPIQGLSVDEVRGIYSGGITNWGQV